MPADKVKKTFKIGDYVVMNEPAIEVGDKFVSKALDNRVACWLGIEAVRQLDASGRPTRARSSLRSRHRKKWACAVRRPRATPSSPTSASGIDVTLACDTPGVPDEESVTKHGLGFGLHIKDSSFISDHKLVKEWRTSRRSTRSRTSGRSSPRVVRTARRPSRPRRAHGPSASPSARGTSTP
jgi:putative aminopeptidase FrvX